MGETGNMGSSPFIVRINAGSVGGVRKKVLFQVDEEEDSQLNPSRDFRSRSHLGGTPDCIPTTEPTTTPRWQLLPCLGIGQDRESEVVGVFVS